MLQRTKSKAGTESRIRSASIALAGTLMVFMMTGAAAQSYPAKTVRFVVPVAPGGATDTLTRALAQWLTSHWSQQVVVENRPGAGSNLAFEVVARSPADGYTLLMAQLPLAANVSLYAKLAYDPLKDFSTVILVAHSSSVLVVHPSVPVRSLREMIALAKSRPGQLTYASSGNGTSPHLSAELLKSLAGIQMVHIPYKGAGMVMNDLIGGHVDLAFVSFTSVLPLLKANRLRALAITSAQRAPLMPDLPTFGEAGLSGFVVTGWYGVVAPAGTPRAIIDRLNKDIAAVIAQPEALRVLGTHGLDPAEANSPDAFGNFLRSEIDRWGKVIKAAGAKAG